MNYLKRKTSKNAIEREVPTLLLNIVRFGENLSVIHDLVVANFDENGGVLIRNLNSLHKIDYQRWVRWFLKIIYVEVELKLDLAEPSHP